MESRNLIYLCVFHQESYITLLKLLMISMSEKADINVRTTTVLVVTSPAFQPLIQKELAECPLSVQYYIMDLHTIMEAACARLNIFHYENIQAYDKILYLDTDILINGRLNQLFNLDISSDKIYALEEGIIGDVFFGAQFFNFSIIDRTISGFTSGILYFHNSQIVKQLFTDIQTHIAHYLSFKRNRIPYCLDQPFIVYNAVIQNKYDNHLMKTYVENNPSDVSHTKLIYHFPGGPGNYDSKYDKMSAFWSKITDRELPSTQIVAKMIKREIHPSLFRVKQRPIN